MLKIFNFLVDQIFPPRTHELLVRELTVSEVSKLTEPILQHEIMSILPYQEPLVEALLQENKFYRNKEATKILAAILNTWLQQKISGPIILIPIPLGKIREKQRGYNQVTEILKLLPSDSSFFIDETILKRQTETAPQTSLRRTKRLENMIGAFECPSPEKLAGYKNKTLIIIDDVSTTGATLQVARATLAPYLPSDTKLICLSLAH